MFYNVLILGTRHVVEIASMALDLLGEKWDFKISRIQNSGLKLRIGIHSGPITGIVTRSPIPRYWLV